MTILGEGLFLGGTTVIVRILDRILIPKEEHHEPDHHESCDVPVVCGCEVVDVEE